MCNPASFVITQQCKTLKVWWDGSTSESHEEIIRHFDLQERNVRDEILLVRVEITPPDNDFTKPFAEWVFKVDQDLLPKWWDAKRAEEAARRELPKWLAAKVVLPGQTVDVLAVGVIIFCGGVVREVRGGGVVRVVRGGGVVQVVRGGGVVQEVWGDGVVREVYCGGVVREVRGGGAVQVVSGGGVVQKVRGGGVVQVVRGGGVVQKVYDDGVVQKVYCGGVVQVVWGGGVVQKVYDGGVVEEVYDGGVVQKVWSDGVVQKVYCGGVVQKVDCGGTVISYTNQLTKRILMECGAVLVDRSGEKVKCYVGKDK